MIFWEYVNPRLNVAFDSHVFWIWNANQWCAAAFEESLWSPPMKEAEIAATLQALIQEAQTRFSNRIGFVDFLVLYGLEDDHWRFVLVGSNATNQFLGMRDDPPAWWKFGEVSPLQGLLLRAQTRHEAIRKLLEQRPRSPNLPLPVSVRGYCATCGLPLSKHVTHNPPGLSPPKSTDAEDWKPYRQAFIKHYWDALQKLTEDELLRMSLPRGAHHLRVLEMEIRRRIDNPVGVKDRLDLILGDDLLES